MRVPRPMAYVCCVVATLGVAAVPASAAHSASTPRTTPEPFATLAPAVQARRLQPLRALASALDDVGRSRFANSYAGVHIDATAGRTVVARDDRRGSSLDPRRRTDRTSAPGVGARQRRRSPRTAGARSMPRSSGYVRGPHPTDVVSVGVSPDRDGIVVSLAGHSAPVHAAHMAASGIPISYRVTARPEVAKSWRAVKWRDSAPFIGGDVLTTDGKRFCTAGLPAIRRSDHHPVLITAAHCFGIGKRVYTGAGMPGHYGNGKVGNYVGKVTSKILQWDAEVIDGTGNNGDVSGTSTWRALTSPAYSYDGDYVCQAGAASYYLGHPTPCGIKVTDDDITIPHGQLLGARSRGHRRAPRLGIAQR